MKIRKPVERIFRVKDKPLILSPSQIEIFDAIYRRPHKRVQIIAPTQYGKSITVATATILRALVFKEDFIILAPSQKKADIIMNYVLIHVFDSDIISSQLELDNENQLERLKRERSKKKITFKEGGSIRTISLDSRNAKRSIEAAMGFGGNRIILDESSLIDDTVYATVKRMVGGHDYEDTFILEIGNPFYRNHFHRTWNSTLYHRIFIDYQTGIKEGRYTQEYIDEMRQEAFFDIFYECKFPDEDMIDSKGYRTLVRADALYNSYTEEIDKKGKLYLGVDIGAGGDFNVYVVRNEKNAWIESKNKSSNTMINVEQIQHIMRKYDIDAYNVFVDDIGVGRGVTDRLKELGVKVNAISLGSTARDSTKYKNIKAEAYWGLGEWISSGGKLEKSTYFEELKEIKYKISTDKLLQIEPKLDMIQRTGKSPDFADALMLTFAPPRPRARAFGHKLAGF